MAAVVQDFEGRYDEVTGRVAELMGVINAANGELVSLLGEALDDGLWDVWGIHSSGHWTGWQTGMAPGRAKAIVGIAERRHELPTAVAALQAGSLSVDAAIEIAKRAPAGYEHDITEFAKQATIGQLRRSLRDYAYDDDTERSKPKPREDTRGVSSGTDERGWWCKGRLDPDEGAVVDHALKAMAEDLRRQARADIPEGEEPQQITTADALLAMGESALRCGEAAFPGSDRYLVHLHLDGHPAPTGGPGDGSRSQVSFHLGGPVPDTLRGLLLCDSSLRATIWDGTTPLNVGRKTRVISRRMRRAIEHRDGGCRVPGCGRITGLEIHHIIHWEHHGPTDTANLVCLCRLHHRTHHKGHLGITGNADLATDDSAGLGATRRPLTFTDPWGHVIAPCGTPVCPDPEATAGESAATLGIVATEEYDHPLGERMQTWGVHFNENPSPPDPPPPSDADPGDDDGPGGGAEGPGPSGRAGHRAPRSDLPVDPRDGGPPTASSPPAA